MVASRETCRYVPMASSDEPLAAPYLTLFCRVSKADEAELGATRIRRASVLGKWHAASAGRHDRPKQGGTLEGTSLASSRKRKSRCPQPRAQVQPWAGWLTGGVICPGGVMEGGQYLKGGAVLAGRHVLTSNSNMETCLVSDTTTDSAVEQVWAVWAVWDVSGTSNRIN